MIFYIINKTRENTSYINDAIQYITIIITIKPDFPVPCNSHICHALLGYALPSKRFFKFQVFINEKKIMFMLIALNQCEILMASHRLDIPKITGSILTYIRIASL